MRTLQVVEVPVVFQICHVLLIHTPAQKEKNTEDPAMSLIYQYSQYMSWPRNHANQGTKLYFLHILYVQYIVIHWQRQRALVHWHVPEICFGGLLSIVWILPVPSHRPFRTLLSSSKGSDPPTTSLEDLGSLGCCPKTTSLEPLFE